MNWKLFQTTELQANFTDSIASQNRGRAISLIDMYGVKTATKYTGDVALHDSNFVFFTSKLEKIHEELVEPKANVTYLDDIPVIYGGGFVDEATYYSVNWAGLIDEQRATVANNANYLPRVNASLNKKSVPVFTFQVGYDIRFIDLEKSKKAELQKSISEIYQDVIVAAWDFYVQGIAYMGYGNKGGGLFNHPDVLPSTIDNAGTTAKGFKGLSDAQVVALFNDIFSTFLKESGNNLRILPDTLLVPTFVGSDLSSRYNQLYTKSLRQYLAENNIAVDESDGKIAKLRIQQRAELDTLGTAGKGRIVAYKKSKEFVRIDVPYVLQHFQTLPNIEKMSYTTAFVGQVSAIQLPYNQKGQFGAVIYKDFTH